MIDRPNPEIIFCDLNLARQIEGADAEGGADFARAHAQLFPETGAASIHIAGGQAAFAGVDSPITQALALGLKGEVSVDEMAELEDFYRSRGAAVNIEVCPLAHPSLNQLLYERRYRPIEQSNVMVRRLPFAEAGLDRREDAARARLARPDEEGLWVKTLAHGFIESEEIPAMMSDLFKTIFHVPKACCFVAEIEGRVVAGGAMSLRPPLAALAGASTLPASRQRGAQNALLRYRLQYAAEQGCDLATVATLPGSGSQRNAERNGFQVAYTRTKWTLDFS
jgi:Acetyltransferase (GNAT) family